MEAINLYIVTTPHPPPHPQVSLEDKTCSVELRHFPFLYIDMFNMKRGKICSHMCVSTILMSWQKTRTVFIILKHWGYCSLVLSPGNIPRTMEQYIAIDWQHNDMEDYCMGFLYLTWISFNPNMDEWLHPV